MRTEATKILMSLLLGVPGLLVAFIIHGIQPIIPASLPSIPPDLMRDPWLYYIGGLLFGFLILMIRYAFGPEQKMRHEWIWTTAIGVIIGIITIEFKLPLMIVFYLATGPAFGYNYIYRISIRQENKEMAKEKIQK